MTSNGVFRQILIIVLFFSFSAGADTGDSAPRCDWLIWDQSRQEQALDRVFTKAFCDSQIYQPELCHANVIQLFRQFKKYYPDVSPYEFNVLYITTEKWVNELEDSETGFHVTSARESYENGEPKVYTEWKYHVVLEFRGRIYDLDYTDQPKPVLAKDYLLSFFMSEELIELYEGELRGDMRELLVYVVPGYFYLNMSAEDSSKAETHYQLMQDNSAGSLVGYLLSFGDL